MLTYADVCNLTYADVCRHPAYGLEQVPVKRLHACLCRLGPVQKYLLTGAKVQILTPEELLQTYITVTGTKVQMLTPELTGAKVQVLTPEGAAADPL
jgi:hypothetical protein